jgi:uncharacterized protein YjbJ (UPF0337 family)
MNKENIEGKYDQVAGKIKEKVGEAFGNEKLANAGVAEQIKGAAKETWGKVKDTANATTDTTRAKAEVEGADLKYRTENAAHNLREKIASTAHNAKENINAKLDHLKHNQERDRKNV